MPLQPDSGKGHAHPLTSERHNLIDKSDLKKSVRPHTQITMVQNPLELLNKYIEAENKKQPYSDSQDIYGTVDEYLVSARLPQLRGSTAARLPQLRGCPPSAAPRLPGVVRWRA